MQLLFLASAMNAKTNYLEVSVEPRDSLTLHALALISGTLSQNRSCQCFLFHFLLPEKYYFQAFFPDQGTQTCPVMSPLQRSQFY